EEAGDSIDDLYFTGIMGSGPHTKLAPNSMREALSGKDTKHWQSTLQGEIQSLIDNDIYKIVPIPKGVKPITSKQFCA
ncbi:hypothetical protein K439DRAFT_1331948, partial [Ramaria rubella]